MDHRCDHLGQLLRDVSGVLLVDRERKQSERKRRIRSQSVRDFVARAEARERNPVAGAEPTGYGRFRERERL